MLNRIKNLRVGCLAALLLLVALPAAAATIEVTPDRNPVPAGESFRLVFSAHGSVDDDPDFTPLQKDFDILSQGRSSQVNIVNGSFSRVTQWTLELMPKQGGELTVPAIHFGTDASPEVKVTVGGGTATAVPGDRDLFLELEVGPRNPYVQAQVLYTVRLLRTVELSQATLSEPQVASGDGMVKKLGEDRHYQTTRGGRTYDVVERTYAIFPQRSGKLTIEPVVFSGDVLTSAFPTSPFDDFFHGAVTHTRRLRSEAVTLDVRPIPAAFRGKQWLPAKSLTLEQSWSADPPQARVGEPLTRTLRLRGAGLTSGQLPELVPADPLKSYPDRPILDEQDRPEGVSGSRQEKIVYIPSQAGNYTLPAVAVPWWNTETDRMEIARLPAAEIRVLPAAGGGTASPPPAAAPAPTAVPSPAAAPPPAVPAAPPAVLAVAPAKPVPPAAASGQPSPTPWGGIPWHWVSLGLALAWAATAAAWGVTRRRAGAAGTTSLSAVPPGAREALGDLRRACAAGDPQQARAALLAWMAARHPGRPATLAALTAEAGEALRRELDILSRSLYGRSGEVWSGSALWQAFRAERDAGKRSAGKPADGLEPLYPVAQEKD